MWWVIIQMTLVGTHSRTFRRHVFLWSVANMSPWWRHQIETFSASLAICAGNSPVTGEFPTQRPVTRSSDVFFDLRLNKRLSKQSWGWWFETHRAHYDVTLMSPYLVDHFECCHPTIGNGLKIINRQEHLQTYIDITVRCQIICKYNDDKVRVQKIL